MDDSKKKGAGAGAVGGAAAGGAAGGVAAGAAVGGMTGPVGAAVGAAVGAGLGAASGKTAAGTSEGGQGESVHTVIGAFDDRTTAERAVDRLTQAGFSREDVHLQMQAGEHAPQTESKQKSGGGFFASLFGLDDSEQESRQQSPYAEHAHTYDEAVRRGSAVVVVDARDDQQAEQACALLHEMGAVDVDERAKQWRAQGWQPPTGASQSFTGSTPARAQGEKEGVLDVVQEELQVGKRSLERGGVRVVQRVSAKPVREVVRLREERAVVDRRPVDRPATGQELSNFREGTLEVRETTEEPVVAKTARVVEEVRVGKEVREREEVVEDNVRRKDVEVERMAGQGARTERQRAVAADEPPTDSRKASTKDKPKL